MHSLIVVLDHHQNRILMIQLKNQDALDTILMPQQP